MDLFSSKIVEVNPKNWINVDKKSRCVFRLKFTAALYVDKKVFENLGKK